MNARDRLNLLGDLKGSHAKMQASQIKARTGSGDDPVLIKPADQETTEHMEEQRRIKHERAKKKAAQKRKAQNRPGVVRRGRAYMDLQQQKVRPR